MRIVFFSRLFYPHIGGVERHVMEISKLLCKKGHDVTIVTEKYVSDLKTKEEIDGIHVYRIPVGGEDWFKKIRIWKELFRLKKIIVQADVVHCHDVFFWYLPFRFFYPHKSVFTTFHGYETSYPPTQKAIIIRKISEKLSRGTLCIGDFIKKWYGAKPDLVTYGGILPSQTSKVQHKSQKHNAHLKVSFIGRLSADTGLLFFKQVTQLLKNKKFAITLDIYGDGPLKKAIEQMGTMHGFIENISDAIAKTDIIFASSYLSILESLTQRKLVFSTYSNPLKEDYLRMAPFAKFIIIENDPEKMAEKIVFYSSHQMDANNLIEQGYIWAKNQTWEKVTEMYLSLWKK